MASTLPPNPEDQPKPPRVYPKLNRRLIILKWLALIGGPVVLIGGAYKCYQQYQLREHGLKIKGTFVTSRTLATGKGRTSYNVIVDYDPPEFPRGIRKEFNVPEDLFNEITRTKETNVTYLPGDPAVSEVGDKVSLDPEGVALGATLLLIGVAIHFYLRRQVRQVEAYVLGETAQFKV